MSAPEPVEGHLEQQTTVDQRDLEEHLEEVRAEKKDTESERQECLEEAKAEREEIERRKSPVNAFELAALTALMGAGDPTALAEDIQAQGKGLTERFLRARSLLSSAKGFLQAEKTMIVREMRNECLVDKEGMPKLAYTFNELIEPIEGSQSSGRKTSATLLGINTLEGVKKRVRKCFPKEVAVRIIAASTVDTRQYLILLHYPKARQRGLSKVEK